MRDQESEVLCLITFNDVIPTENCWLIVSGEIKNTWEEAVISILPGIDA
jgi:hypothetical protein